VANCGDFDKISKRPLEERVAWVDQHLATIKFAAKYPLEAVNWWKQADKPWMFLAACMELANALTFGSEFVTRLPVSFDGSCSGLQHLACLTRDEQTAQLVNLIPGDTPEDVYQRVADRVTQKLTVLAEHGDAMAKLWLSYGITRTVVKRNVMVYSYSSKKFGMAKQQEEDLMQPLKNEVLEGKLAEHPFATEHDFVIDKKTGKKIGKDAGHAAAKYIAGIVYETIVELVKKPAEAMGFLQDCARALAHEGKPLRWTTPTGLPWINRYHEPKLQKVKLWLYDKGVKVRKSVLLAVGSEPEIAKDRAANGVAPNLVHACDAAHLMLTVNAAVKEGITNIATVHDSFGCLAPQAARFNAIIREQMVEMYQRDILAEVLASAKHDLTVANWHRLPELPDYGKFNLTGVVNAPFAFA
jgi:DNA-directed RNA polymerase